MGVNREACEKAMTPELFATEKVYKLVKEGMPFRQAYQKIAKEYVEGCSTFGSTVTDSAP
jgi:argininosuccinate lyase